MLPLSQILSRTRESSVGSLQHAHVVPAKQGLHTHPPPLPGAALPARLERNTRPSLHTRHTSLRAPCASGCTPCACMPSRMAPTPSPTHLRAMHPGHAPVSCARQNGECPLSLLNYSKQAVFIGELQHFVAFLTCHVDLLFAFALTFIPSKRIAASPGSQKAEPQVAAE